VSEMKTALLSRASHPTRRSKGAQAQSPEGKGAGVFAVEPLEPRLLLSASTPFELASLPAENGGDGTLGFILKGTEDLISVSNAGDINGDGFDDLVIGFSDGGFNQSGKAKVVFGKAGGFDAMPDLTRLDGSNGFTATDSSYLGRVGSSVSGAGDINGDGFDDLIVGAQGGYHYSYNLGEVNGSSGRAYIIFGKARGFKADIDLRKLNGKNGFTFFPTDYVTDVSSAGDINGDGFDDMVFTGNSKGYIVFGKAGGFDAWLSDFSFNGTNGFTVTGVGSSVSGGGDINGDGYTDLIFSGGQESAVIFGKASGFTASLDAATLDGANGFNLASDATIRTVSLAGDVNGDGFDDLILGASRSYTTPRNGGIFRGSRNEGYVVFGRAGGFPSRLDLPTLDGTNGFVLNGIDEGGNSSMAVSNAGDVNDDGFDDLIIGASFADSNGVRDAGKAYVLFGMASGFSSIFDVSTLDGTNGFIVNGTNEYDRAGGRVKGLGDINRDGFDDLAILARGEINVIYGGGFIDDLLETGTDGPDVLIGTSAKDLLIGNLGDDLLIGNGGADTLLGGAGDDILAVSDQNFTRIAGGDGTDTLRLDAAGAYLALTGSLIDRVTDVEVIDITGTGANTLILNKQVVLRITDYPSTLTVLGDADDSVFLGSEWALIGNEVIGADTFNIYKYDGSSARVKVADTVQVMPAPPAAVDGDFTGDGKADIIWRDTRDGSNAVWQFDGTTFQLETRIRRLKNTDWKLVGTGDFTGDGKNDILWRNTRDGRNRVWEMDGTTFQNRVDIKPLTSLDWRVAGVGDFTGDGRDDILWRNTRNGRNVAWNMFGTVFLESISLKALRSQRWQAAGVGDLTGDGKDDILWRNRTNGKNAVWKMDGTTFQSNISIKELKNPAWQIAGIADYTGDGVADILWRHTTKGSNSVWQMGNTTFQVGIPLPSLTELRQQPASPLLGLWEG
jgi:FG-GAP-like repeat/FG-GAP repeat/RTX calcium-binding nonapeptide repeat (4 copies)